MLQRPSAALAAALVKIDAWPGRTPPTDPDAVGRRIGRAMGKSPAAAAIVQARGQNDSGGRARGLQLAGDVATGQKARIRCAPTARRPIRRNRGVGYIQLTPAEAAFRPATSDLGLRPIDHQLEDRGQAHILVCFLALALRRTLEQWLHARSPGSCGRQLRKNDARIKSMDALLPVRRGELTTVLRLRVVATPAPAPAQLLAHLGRRLPKGPREIANVVPKTGG